MFEKGLYQAIIKRFEGECPVVINSAVGKEYLNALNIGIRRQILNGYFEDVVSLLRNCKVSYIDNATWNYLADYLEGKLSKKRGAKQKSNYFRDELITLKMIELVMIHNDVSDALIEMTKLDDTELGIKAIEAIYYTNCKCFGDTFTLEDVKKWGLDIQSKENERRSILGKKAIKYFIADQN